MSSSSSSQQRELLPNNVVPSSYSIHLVVPNSVGADIDDTTKESSFFDFQGQETIEIDVIEDTSVITLHCLTIQIKKATFSSSSNPNLEATVSYDEKAETASLDFGKSLGKGKAQLNIDYSGNLNDKMVGFYRSKYAAGEKSRFMATTQFEATDARRAFPCWDEPSKKATYSITLSYPNHLTPLSNMPEIKTVDHNSIKNYKTTSFQPTVVMSTYLVAFCIGEYDFVEKKNTEGVQVRVYTPLGKKEQGEFALDVACRTLSYFGEFYGIQYPLPKLDMIAISDFAAGAMENWGLVTYRETALLIDSKNSAVASKQRVAYVVGHELAHQWFGNLVSPEWWKELWLNEGFATWVGTQSTNHLFPEWDMWTGFLSQYTSVAFKLDSLETSHPIEVEVKNSAQINEIFDMISYAKGASVIRQVNDYVGADEMKKGLNTYLKEFQYKNAVTKDLWRHLGQAASKDVAEFMSTYTQNTGYPVLSISESDKPDQFKVSQKRFFASGTKADDTLWRVYLRVGANDGSQETFDLKAKEDVFTFKDFDKKAWVKANFNQTGFYRVKYSENLLSKLAKGIQDLSLATPDRIALQSDVWALSQSGETSAVQALELTKFYSNEDNVYVWQDLTGSLGEMLNVWGDTSYFEKFKPFLRNLLSKIAKKLGWVAQPNESSSDTLLRSTVLYYLTSAGDEETIKEANAQFEKFLKDNASVSPDIRYLIFANAVRVGGKDGYEKVLNIYKTADIHEERIRALRALGVSLDVELLKRTLEFSLTEEVRSGDIVFAVNAVGQSSALGRRTAWEFLRQNWDRFENRLRDSQFLFGRLISASLTGFADQKVYDEAKEFFKAHPHDSAARTIEQTLEKILIHKTWLETNEKAVGQWFEKN